MILLTLFRSHLAQSLRLAVFVSFGGHRKGRLNSFFGKKAPESLQRKTEEFFPEIDLVDAQIIKFCLQHILKSRRVLAGDHCVDVKFKQEK